MSREVRVLEFEATVAATAPAGALEISGYAVYDVRQDVNGTCGGISRSS